MHEVPAALQRAREPANAAHVAGDAFDPIILRQAQDDVGIAADDAGFANESSHPVTGSEQLAHNVCTDESRCAG